MKNVHFIGIEGSGMSGLARMMLSLGLRVSGSDLNPAEQSRRLQESGAVIHKGHGAAQIDGEVDTVVASAAIKPDNPEMQAAREKNLPVYRYAEMLGHLMNTRFGLAVAGTHGKSTTSGMLAYVLESSRMSPSFVIGAQVPQLGGNSQLGQGPHFVVEACEYAGSFLNLHPKMAIITNIDADHLDYYKDLDAIAEAFEKFAGNLPQDGVLVIGKQAVERFSRKPECRMETYGVGEEADWQILNLSKGILGYEFEAIHRGKSAGRFETTIPGMHNVSNALAVIALCSHIGVPYPMLCEAVKNYRGVSRRFDTLYRGPVTIIDDYGHHPTEIKALLSAARDRFPESRIWCVFQPHQASRTYRLLAEFASCFEQADEVIVTDIYFARDSAEARSKVTSADLVEAIRSRGKSARHLPTFPAVMEFLPKHWQEGDVVFTVGAGDIFQLGISLCESAVESNYAASCK